MNKRIQIMLAVVLAVTISASPARTFIHPGILHTQTDITRMIAKVNAGAEPWKAGWDRLTANAHAQTGYMPNPQDSVCCGTGGCPGGETFMPLANDCAAAYQCALRYRISGNTVYADKAVAIMNAWSSLLKAINGDSNAGLRAGLYGYQFAAAGELMRDYSGWAAADFARFKTMMLTKFYTINSDFLVRHNGTCFDHYWANWDLANMTSIIAIAVLCDDTAKFNEAVNYFKGGTGTGQIDRLCNNLYPGTPVLGQGQESGRDQGHATLCISLVGAFCQIAYDQGQDLFAYKDNKVLALCEYTAKYNLDQPVPWTNYTNCENNAMMAVSSDGRGTLRPCWELIYNHYVRLKRLYAPFSRQFADTVRPEGGGGDYGPNSGGYDQLGFGTLTFTIDSGTSAARSPVSAKSPPVRSIRIVSRRVIISLAAKVRSTVILTDPRGKTVDRKIVGPGEQVCVFDPAKLSPGIYLVLVRDLQGDFFRPVVIAR